MENSQEIIQNLETRDQILSINDKSALGEIGELNSYFQQWGRI